MKFRYRFGVGAETQQPIPSERIMLERRYHSARSDILYVLIFTVINLALLLFDSNTYFLFSAFLPYFAVSMGKILCGMMPDDYYTDGLEGLEPIDSSFFAVMLAFAIIGTALYFISWLLSKKHKIGWMIFALVIFAIDTLLFLLLSFSMEAIVDLIFHVWFIVGLSRGIHAHYKLLKLPEEEVPLWDAEMTLDPDAPLSGGEYVSPEEPMSTPVDTKVDTAILYPADTSVKHRVLLETNAFGHNVCYRRVKRRNELIIDGNVYDTYEALVEQQHELKASFDGHTISAGYNGTHSYIAVDGEIFEKKIRLV